MAHREPIPARPISPHLTIFYPLVNMVMSILHRATGMALYVGMAFLAWWLVAAASGPEAYATAQAFFGSWLGLVVLLGFTWALLHHLLGGVRHLIWDAGYGMTKPARDWLCWATIIGSVALTVLVWAIGYLVR